MNDAIDRRALTFKWVNARIVASVPAAPECVARFGDPQNASNGEVRLLMHWSDADRSRIVAEAPPEEVEDVGALLGHDVELRVVCSRDVIYHDFPGIDLD